MCFLEGILFGKVADVDIEDPVAIDVTEVHPHALERILPEHVGGRGEERGSAPQRHEKRCPALLRDVVQYLVGADIVGQIKIHPHVAIDVESAHGHRPSARDLIVDGAFHLAKGHARVGSADPSLHTKMWSRPPLWDLLFLS